MKTLLHPSTMRAILFSSLFTFATYLSSDAQSDSWIQINDLGYDVANAVIPPVRFQAVGFSIGNKGYAGTGIAYGYYQDFWEYDAIQNAWTQKADFAGGKRYGAIGFSIGNKGYLGTGAEGNNWKKDFWEYDPVANTWTAKAAFGGGVRAYSTAFSINGKGYIGTGFDGNNYRKDFWEYDPVINSWVQKSDFGGTIRGYATGFTLDNNGYVGTGWYFNGGDPLFYKDFWKYDAVTDSWAQVEDFGGDARYGAVSFSIGNKGYLGTGAEDGIFDEYVADFWQYDPDADKWTEKAYFSGDDRYFAVGFSVGGIGYLGTGVGTGYHSDFFSYDPAADAWTTIADLGGKGRGGAVSLAIGSKGYVGLGRDQSLEMRNDFWEYDPSNGTWTQKANFGGEAREFATGFSIGNIGYVGTGVDDGSHNKKDFWAYDPLANGWTKKAGFGGKPRFGAVGFSIGDKGYLGTGFRGANYYEKDFWEYDPSMDAWTQKADFLGTARDYAVGLSIGSKGYIGTGFDQSQHYKKDFWEYNPDNNTWTQKADFGGTPRRLAVGFTIGSKGYIGTGRYFDGTTHYYKDFWEYDTDNNTWTQKSDFGGTSRDNAVAFCVNNKGYVGTGYDGEVSQDFWEYTPENSPCNDPDVPAVSASVNPICNGNSTTLSIASGNLNSATGWQWYTGSCGETPAGSGSSIEVAPISSTTYFVRGEGGCVITGNCGSLNVTVNLKPIAKIKASGDLDICNTGFVKLIAADGIGYIYQWTRNLITIPGATNRKYHATQTGNYRVIVTNADECTATSNKLTVYTSCKMGDQPNDLSTAIKLYPNPTSGTFIIEMTLDDQVNTNSDIQLVNILGQVVYEKFMPVTNGRLQQEIQLSDQMAKGIYLVKVIIGDSVYSARVDLQ